mgnify:CR=1 FL=1
MQVSDYKTFLKNIVTKKILFFNDTIIDISNKIIYDIEIGEDDYEIRIMSL